MFDRFNTKQSAKNLLHKEQRFFFILFIPFIVVLLLSSAMDPTNNAEFQALMTGKQVDANALVHSTVLNSNTVGQLIFSIVSGIFLMGAVFTTLDVVRNQDDLQRPLRKSISFIDNQRLFWGVIAVFIVKSILNMLWYIVFIVPGFIKNYSYSQAVYIYRDAFLAGKPIGIFEAITESRKMMDGYKGSRFVMDLSFIGWLLLSGLTAGIAGIYVYPYYYITAMKFYEFVKQQYTAA